MFDAEKAHKEQMKRLDEIVDLLETLTVINAAAAGIPSTKIRDILKMDQSRVSNISKHIKQK
jgi:hypothetical protein